LFLRIVLPFESATFLRSAQAFFLRRSSFIQDPARNGPGDKPPSEADSLKRPFPRCEDLEPPPPLPQKFRIYRSFFHRSFFHRSFLHRSFFHRSFFRRCNRLKVDSKEAQFRTHLVPRAPNPPLLLLETATASTLPIAQHSDC
ncbi:hypothetical protein CLOP_g19645, partial [Closterium sp. NIES-67]